MNYSRPPLLTLSIFVTVHFRLCVCARMHVCAPCLLVCAIACVWRTEDNSLLQVSPGAWHQVVRIGHRYLYSLRPLPTKPSNHWAIWPLMSLTTEPSDHCAISPAAISHFDNTALKNIRWCCLLHLCWCTPHTHSSMPCRANSITETCFDLDLWWSQQTGGPLKGWVERMGEVDQRFISAPSVAG